MSTNVNITELRRMLPDELSRELKLKRAEAAKVRMGLELGGEKNHAQYRTMKRDVARMTMVLDELHSKVTPAPVVKTTEKTSTKAKKSVKDTGSTSTKKKKAA